jgi:hypothetical protein
MDSILKVFVAVCGNICFRGNKPEDMTDNVRETKCFKHKYIQWKKSINVMSSDEMPFVN